MEPVSRHLGNHILKTNNHNSYCVFATNNLHVNVISDFRMRKTYPYYDPHDDSRYIDGMKIIPLQISDLRIIIMMHKDYSELYHKYESAYKTDFKVRPKDWYEYYVRSVNSLSESLELKQYADKIMTFNRGISLLQLQQRIIEEFGEKYSLMKNTDWNKAIRAYIKDMTSRTDIQDDENVTWMIAADANDYVPAIATD
jgi:hypothetical protein